jgi:hypothetical protein
MRRRIRTQRPRARTPRQPGTAYLLCFDRPHMHARHYLGWTADPLQDRLHDMLAGRGLPRLMRAVHAAEIGWTLVRTWPGTRDLERRLRAQGTRARLCPRCAPAAFAGRGLERKHARLAGLRARGLPSLPPASLPSEPTAPGAGGEDGARGVRGLGRLADLAEILEKLPGRKL